MPFKTQWHSLHDQKHHVPLIISTQRINRSFDTASLYNAFMGVSPWYTLVNRMELQWHTKPGWTWRMLWLQLASSLQLLKRLQPLPPTSWRPKMTEGNIGIFNDCPGHTRKSRLSTFSIYCQGSYKHPLSLQLIWPSQYCEFKVFYINICICPGPMIKKNVCSMTFSSRREYRVWVDYSSVLNATFDSGWVK